LKLSPRIKKNTTIASIFGFVFLIFYRSLLLSVFLMGRREGAHSASKALMSRTTVVASSHRSFASGICSTMGYYIQVVCNCHYL